MNNLDDLFGQVKAKLEDKPVKKKGIKKKKSPCEKCSLNGKVKVPLEGDLETARVMFIGEAPGAHEEEDERPFVGRAGELLRGKIKKAGIKEEDICFTNVCKCRPPLNMTPTDKDITCCTKNLKEEIDNFKGDLIVILGAVPLKAVLGKRNITNNRGYGFQIGNKNVLVMYHPAYILRNRSTAIEDGFDADMSKVYTYLYEDEHSIDYALVKDNQDLELMLTEILTEADTQFLSFDIETTGFDAGKDSIVSMAFHSDGKTWVIPMEHPESPWFGKSKEVMRSIQELFQNDRFMLIAQNGKFDIKFVKQNYGIQITNFKFDTMIAHFLLVGKFISHAQKSCAWRYTKHGGYGLDRDNIMNYTYQEILDYNAMDAFVARKLAEIYSRKMDKLQVDLMFETLAPATMILAEMEMEGVKLDKGRLEKLTDEYIKELTEIEKRMHSYPKIKEIEKASNKIVNFKSTKQLARVFELMRIDTGKKTKKKKVMCTDAKALQGVQGKHKLIKDIIDFRKKDKILGTYLKPYVEKEKEGRVHFDYSLINTATGRPNSFNPNAQNIPYNTRPVFMSSNGYFLEADYSQLELRVLAMLSNDEALIDDFMQGRDVHESTRLKLFGDNSNESGLVQVTQRVDAKGVNFGIVYGITAQGMAESTDRPVHVCQKWIDSFHEEHPRVKIYQSLVWEHVKEYGYIDTPFGRVRYFNYSKDLRPGQKNALFREAVNTPIQGSASDLVFTGLGRVWREMRKRNMKSRILIEVHDSAVFDCYEDEIFEIVKICQSNLTQFDYEWMRGVPLEVDYAVGTHWGELKEL